MIWMLLAALPAHAQETPIVPRLNAQLYRPVIDATDTLWTESAGAITGGELAPAPRIALHYVNRPLVFVPEDGGEPTYLVSDVLQLDAIFATTVDRFRFALDLPVYLYSAGQLTDDGPGIGDIAADVRVTLLDPDEAPAGLAVSGRLGFPSATVDSPLGDSAISGELVAVGEVRPSDALTVAANLGTRINPRTELANAAIDDQLVWRLGGGYALSDGAGLSLDLAGRTSYATAAAAGTPVEALVGGWARVSEEWVLRVGAGRGVTPGIGSPQLRLVTMLTLDPPVVRDSDADGVVDGDDGCPTEPEDVDGFQDDDGCPEIDNDGDGLLDAADTCINDPEDLDDFEDDDGCPDPTSQVALRVTGAEGDALPRARVTVVGPQTMDGTGDWLVDLHAGTYTIRASHPGYVDGERAVEVPVEGEVTVQLEPLADVGTLQLMVLDEQGEPVDVSLTVDGEAVPGTEQGAATLSLASGDHTLALVAEGFVSQTLDVTIAADEVLDEVVVMRLPRVEVTRERIDISESIYFETGSAVIQEQSHSLMDEIVATMVEHDELERVRIEGHTDERGSEATNQRLSEERAASVMAYLVEAGIDAGRLEAEGFGESQPVDDRSVPEAWNKNRRVDFVIVERAGN